MCNLYMIEPEHEDLQDTHTPDELVYNLIKGPIFKPFTILISPLSLPPKNFTIVNEVFKRYLSVLVRIDAIASSF